MFSWEYGSCLDELDKDWITFHSMQWLIKERIQLEAIEQMIYRQGEDFRELIKTDNWSKAMDKMELLYEDHVRSIEGLSLVRRTEASMEMLMGFGRWDQSRTSRIILPRPQSWKNCRNS